MTSLGTLEHRPQERLTDRIHVYFIINTRTLDLALDRQMVSAGAQRHPVAKVIVSNISDDEWSVFICSSTHTAFILGIQHSRKACYLYCEDITAMSKRMRAHQKATPNTADLANYLPPFEARKDRCRSLLEYRVEKDRILYIESRRKPKGPEISGNFCISVILTKIRSNRGRYGGHRFLPFEIPAGKALSLYRCKFSHKG